MKQRVSPKRVIVHKNNPDGAGVCDGCGFVVPYNDLKEQMDYRGGSNPVGLGLRVCSMCYDTPNAQLKKQIFKPDPVPFKNPRPVPQNIFGTTTEEELNREYWQGG